MARHDGLKNLKTGRRRAGRPLFKERGGTMKVTDDASCRGTRTPASDGSGRNTWARPVGSLL